MKAMLELLQNITQHPLASYVIILSAVWGAIEGYKLRWDNNVFFTLIGMMLGAIVGVVLVLIATAGVLFLVLLLNPPGV